MVCWFHQIVANIRRWMCPCYEENAKLVRELALANAKLLILSRAHQNLCDKIDELAHN